MSDYNFPKFSMAPAPIGGSLAWTRKTLEEDTSWMNYLSDSEIAELELAAYQTAHENIAIQDISTENFKLPTLQVKLSKLKQDVLEDYGFGYMRGLPVAKYDRETLARIYFGLSAHLGDPVAQNRNGHLLGHVIDIGTDVNDFNKRITQTSAELDFHSDGCDVVGLVCINTAKKGGSSALVSAVAVHDEMFRSRPELCEALYQPILFDRRGEIPEGKKPWIYMPIFSWQNETFNAYCPLKNYVESAKRFEEAKKMTPLQEEAYAYFLDLCNDPRFAIEIPFEAGDFQFVHNHVVLHSRTAYEDWEEQSRKRHLMRIWLSMPDGRLLPKTLEERWVNIELGTIRGGVNIPNRKSLKIPLDIEEPAY